MVYTKSGTSILEALPVNIEWKLRESLSRVDLEKSNVIVISRFSRMFEEFAIADLKERINARPTHFFSFHLSLNHAASLVFLGEGDRGDFRDLIKRLELIVLHDVEDVSSIRKFTSKVRSSLEKKALSKVVLTMRPATAHQVYKGMRAPLYGRVVKIEEPNYRELGITEENTLRCGFLDLYAAHVYDRLNVERAIKNPESASFNVLSLFWQFLINDSQKAGSVRVVSSCIAYHDEPMTISDINMKCGIKHGRQTVHAAVKTGLMKMTKGTPKRAYLYPPLLESWIKENVPFFPT